jgi:hypothetical protein
MRFLGKYELLEQLTVGPVETFVAYPIGGGERLLVHVFALPALVKSGLKNSDLVEYMEAMSPKPLGSVLDAGRYDDGTQAFVVTKFPRDPNALPNWIEAYKSAAKKQDTTTVEAPVQQMWGGSKSEPKSTSAAEHPVGDFTRAFQSAGLPSAIGKSPLPTEAFDLPLPATTQNIGDGTSSEARSNPGTLSKLTAALGEGARLTRLSPSAEPAMKIDPAPAASDLSRWEPEGDSISTEEQTSDATRPGDFTNFFKSPFASPSPVSETSFEQEPLRQPPSRPAKGDFTQMFGSPLPASSTWEEPSKPLLEPASQNQGFTGLFGESPTPVPPIVFPSKEPFEPTQHPERYATAQRTNPPVFTAARPSVDPVFSSNASMENSTPVQGQVEGATRLFRPPAQAAPAPEAAEGESEYTRIISAKASPSAPGANATPKQTPGGVEPPKLSVPVPPPIPHLQMPAPVIAAPPPVPSVQWPATPQLQVPKVPTFSAAAEKGSKKTGWTAYVPLIVILNLLLLAAIGLVLYFIFKQ